MTRALDPEMCRHWRLTGVRVIGDRVNGTWEAARGGAALIVKYFDDATFPDWRYPMRVAASLRAQGWPTHEPVEEPLIGPTGAWVLPLTNCRGPALQWFGVGGPSQVTQAAREVVQRKGGVGVVRAEGGLGNGQGPTGVGQSLAVAALSGFVGSGFAEQLGQVGAADGVGALFGEGCDVWGEDRPPWPFGDLGLRVAGRDGTTQQVDRGPQGVREWFRPLPG